MVLFVFQLSSVCNIGKFINFGFGTVRSERVILSVVAAAPVTVNKVIQL